MVTCTAILPTFVYLVAVTWSAAPYSVEHDVVEVADPAMVRELLDLGHGIAGSHDSWADGAGGANVELLAYCWAGRARCGPPPPSFYEISNLDQVGSACWAPGNECDQWEREP